MDDKCAKDLWFWSTYMSFLSWTEYCALIHRSPALLEKVDLFWTAHKRGEELPKDADANGCVSEGIEYFKDTPVQFPPPLVLVGLGLR